MRSPLFLAAVLVAGTAATGPAPVHAQAFEGRITYEMSVGGTTMQVAQAVKGTKLRQELEGPMGSMVTLFDTETMDMTMMMPAQKMYMQMNAGQMMQQMQAMQGQQAPEQPDPEDLKATGRTETIAGEECEHYTYSSDDGEMDMCIASGLGFVPLASGGMPGMASPDAWRARFSNGFLPLSMTYTSQGQTTTMKATEVERGSVPAAEFEVPEGYTRIPGMGG